MRVPEQVAGPGRCNRTTAGQTPGGTSSPPRIALCVFPSRVSSASQAPKVVPTKTTQAGRQAECLPLHGSLPSGDRGRTAIIVTRGRHGRKADRAPRIAPQPGCRVVVVDVVVVGGIARSPGW